MRAVLDHAAQRAGVEPVALPDRQHPAAGYTSIAKSNGYLRHGGQHDASFELVLAGGVSTFNVSSQPLHTPSIDIPHANLYLCSGTTSCSPFVVDTPGPATHMPALAANLDTATSRAMFTRSWQWSRQVYHHYARALRAGGRQGGGQRGGGAPHGDAVIGARRGDGGALPGRGPGHGAVLPGAPHFPVRHVLGH